MQSLQFIADSLKITNPSLNRINLVANQIHHMLTRRFVALSKGQDLHNLIEGKIQRPRASNELQPVHVILAVYPVTVLRTLRFREQADVLIVTDGLARYACLFAQLTDLQHFSHLNCIYLTPSSNWNVKPFFDCVLLTLAKIEAGQILFPATRPLRGK
jgi:hypothetical protein